MEEFNLDFGGAEDKAAQIRSRVAGDVLQAFAQGPAAAQTAAGLNNGHATSAAIVAVTAAIASAIQQLQRLTAEQGDLEQSTVDATRDVDNHNAVTYFSRDKIFPGGTSGGTTNA